MNGFSFVLLIFAAFFGWRALGNFADKSETNRYHSEEFERIKSIVERDPTNSGTRAQYAGLLMKAGDVEGAIHQYRTAIGNSPHGPFTDSWKRKLKEALEVQAILTRGERVPGFDEWRTCRKCQAKLTLSDKTCPKCGEVQQMGVGEWVQSEGVMADIWRQSWPIALVLWIAAIVFSALPIEWQGTLIIASLFVGFWLFVRSFNV